jgi:hypothetical protein
MTAGKHSYHIQHQAERFARQIIAVPEDYPVRRGLPEDYPAHFPQLCALAKSVYLHMAQEPEAYGLPLLETYSGDYNLARDSMRAIHRFADTLSAMFLCGSVHDHVLAVHKAAFTANVKAIPKYRLILERLQDFGFVFSGLSVNNGDTEFTVEFPDSPYMIDTINTYCACWNTLKDDRKEIKLLPKEFHHHFYRFDYKITAELSQIPLPQWIAEEADYLCYSPEQKAFSIAFYAYSLRYKELKFDGEYYYKSKRIARIYETEYPALGHSKYRFTLKLSNMDHYRGFIEQLPTSLKTPFEVNNCKYCGFQGSTKDFCKYRLHWSLNDHTHTGCIYQCFIFDDFNLDSIPFYFMLLELEYGLKTMNGEKL